MTKARTTNSVTTMAFPAHLRCRFEKYIMSSKFIPPYLVEHLDFLRRYLILSVAL